MNSKESLEASFALHVSVELPPQTNKKVMTNISIFEIAEYKLSLNMDTACGFVQRAKGLFRAKVGYGGRCCLLAFWMLRVCRLHPWISLTVQICRPPRLRLPARRPLHLGLLVLCLSNLLLDHDHYVFLVTTICFWLPLFVFGGHYLFLVASIYFGW